MTSEETLRQRASARAAASRLRLPLRSRVWRGQAGEFAGGGTGSSLNFQDHRHYSPGDDPRHINWQAYARTGQHTMKLFREETRPVVDLLLDASESMFHPAPKAALTTALLHLLADGCRADGVSLEIHALRGGGVERVPTEALEDPRWLDELRGRVAEADPSLPPEPARAPLRANAIRVFLSDLLFPGEPEPLLQTLGRRHGSAILLCPFSTAEASPPWAGNHEFVDVETGRREAHRIDPTTLRRYQDAYQGHFAMWKQAARRQQAAFARIPAEEELLGALFAHAVPAGALEPIA